MECDLVDVEGFQMALPDPFLEALINLVAEPNGTLIAQQAYESAREWWDQHLQGPTSSELIDAVFEPGDWLNIIGDRARPRASQEAQLHLLREWLLLYWSRAGAISFVAGVDLVIRPGGGSFSAFDGRDQS